MKKLLAFILSLALSATVVFGIYSAFKSIKFEDNSTNTNEIVVKN